MKMLINGSTLSSTDAVLSKIQSISSDHDELELRAIDFDVENSRILITKIFEISNSNLHEWKSIHLVHCHGSDVSDFVMMCMNPKLKILKFTWDNPHHFRTTPFTIFAIAHGIKYSPYLTQLTLTIDMTTDVANTLGRAIAMSSSTLTELNLTCSTISDMSSIQALGFGLRLNRSIVRFNLDNCRLCDDYVFEILYSIQHDSSKITHLSLSQNYVHTKSMSAIGMLLHCDQLEELHLSYLLKTVTPKEEQQQVEENLDEQVEEQPSEQDPNEEAASREDNQETEQQGMRNEKSKDDGTQQTGQDADSQATQNQGNQDPDKVNEEDDGSSSTKVSNTSLRVLNMAGNNLSDAYVESLLPIFGSSSQLQELNMFGNRITDRGIQLIARKVLKDWKYLRYLIVGQNYFTTIGARQLLQSVQQAATSMVEDVSIRSLFYHGTNAAEMEGLQQKLDYYCRLNRGGRRILSQQGGKSDIFLHLYPFVMERANKMFAGDENSADVIFCLLHGPVLFENPNLPTQKGNHK